MVVTVVVMGVVVTVREERRMTCGGTVVVARLTATILV
jgi:hypothetical protein